MTCTGERGSPERPPWHGTEDSYVLGSRGLRSRDSEGTGLVLRSSTGETSLEEQKGRGSGEKSREWGSGYGPEEGRKGPTEYRSSVKTLSDETLSGTIQCPVPGPTHY